MGGSTSPDMKPCEAERPGYVFKSGLVGPFSANLMFSNLDIFIEKPFSVLSFHVCQLCKTGAKTAAASLKSKAALSETVRARARKQRLSQEASFSVETTPWQKADYV